MPTKQQIVEVIFSVINEQNKERPASEALAAKPDTVLFGQGATLDSLGLVGLVIATEQKVEETFSIAISLTDEKAMSQRNSPFRNVDTLAMYIEQLLNESNRG